MTRLRAVLLAPPGTQPKLLRWHHVWLAFALTGLGFCVGVLTLMLAATAYLKLNSTDLFLSYFLLEPMLLLLNVLPPILLIWFFYFLTRRAWAAFLGSFLPCVGLALVNYFKIRLRGDPLLAADLRLVTEAGGIVGHYQLDLTWLVWLCAACLILGLLFSVFLLPRGIGRGPLRWFCLCSSAALLAVSYAALYCDQSLYDRTANDTHITPWSDVEVFVSRGCLYPFLYSVQDMFPTPPEDYDPEEAASLLARYPDQDIPADRRVNVVGVMLEAFCDLTDFPALAEQPAVQAVYAPLHDLEEQSVSGDLLTNIFAGGTVDSEWGFLTGYTQHEDFRKPTDSYVWYFREQGYHTLFHHPGYSWFYNRQNVNEYLGFEESWFTENYYGALVDPVDAVMRSDETLVDGILDGLREPGPWFSFSVSYQNHGPYETASAQEVFLSPGDTGWSAETCNMLNNYMSNVSSTLAAMERLTRELNARPEPFVLVLFGDHKPWMGNGNMGYTEIGAGFDLSQLSGFREYYSTPYLIWANSAAREALGNSFTGEGGDFSPCFLMNKVFELCGWEGPGFMELSRQLEAISPLIHTRGLFLSGGILTDALVPEEARFYQQFLQAQYYRETVVIPGEISS